MLNTKQAPGVGASTGSRENNRMVTRMKRFETSHCSGESIAFHRHDIGYISLVLEGGYDEISVDGRWRCRAGDIVVHPPYHLHRNKIFHCGAQVLNYSFHLKAQELFPALSYRLCRPGQSGKCLNKRAEFDDIVEDIENANEVAPQPPSDWIDEVAEYLIENPTARITAIARCWNVSPEHLSRVFKRRIGLSPIAYRNEIRFRKIFGEIALMNKSFVHIAQNNGFADQAHTTRAVVNKTRMTPTQIREAYN